MTPRLPTPIPGTALLACANPKHSTAYRPKDGCRDCNNHRDRRSASDAGSHDPAQVRSRRTVPATPRAGKLAEDALCAALVAAGHEVITFREWLWRAMDGTRFLGFVREFNAGALLAEPRRFRCDLLHPSSRTAIEVEGGAHGVQKQRRKDILREQLLTAAGLRVVRLLPEQVRGGEALALVVKATEAR